MKDNDILQPFIFEHANIRGYLVNLTETYQTIINQRPYPPAVKTLLGEAMICCLFLTASLKFEGKLSVQFHGDDRLPLLIVQCDNELQLRAMAKYEEGLNPEDYHQAFLNGKLSITINMAHQHNAYQSVVPIHSSSMSENLMHYLTQSEQITNQVWLAASDQQVAGMMLQLMPDKDTRQQEQFWEYALAIGQTLKDEELLSLDNQTLLHRLYHETELRLFDSRPVHFKCGCSEDKMKNVILMLGETDAQQIIKEHGKIEMHCDFCNKHYQFDSIDTTALFHKNSIEQGKYFDPDVEIVKEIKAPRGKKSK